MSRTPPRPLTPQQQAEWDALVTEGEAVLATKTLPTSRIRGDWQSTETVYAVVQPQAFTAWRNRCLAFLASVDADWAAAYESTCRRPGYLEALEGQKRLLRG